LTQYLLPHAAQLEKSANPNAKGSQAWGWLPPPLLGEGAKVRPEWLHDYLLAPYTIRPASFMRMPKYNLSAAEAGALADYFAAQDRMAYPYQTIDRRDRAYLQQAEQAYREQRKARPGPERAADPDRLAAAVRIVTDKNYCVTCHMVGDYDPRTSDRAKGPNLADVYKRFRPDYVRRWVAEPVSVLPYTGMPIIIPYQPDAPNLGGVDQSLYPGTSTQQLDALVDLLMNFDAYTRRRAPFAPLVEAAAAPATAAEASTVKTQAAADKPAPRE
jgi:cbb3-type cytochrome oxidase cytochrome c subunit